MLAQALSASFVVILITSLLIAVKRLCFHPLSKVPGPRLAAATGWFEFYYDVIRGGAYLSQILESHEKYGKSLGDDCALSVSVICSICAS